MRSTERVILAPDAAVPAADQFLLNETVRQHGRATGVLPVIGLTVAVGLLVVVWPEPSPSQLLNWFALVSAAIALRGLAHLAVHSRLGAGLAPARRLAVYRLSILVHGCAWGAASLLLHDGELGFGHQAVMFAVLIMVVGTAVSGSFDLIAAMLFTATALVPSAAHYVTHELTPWNLLALSLSSSLTAVATLRNRRGFVRDCEARRQALIEQHRESDNLDRLRRAIAVAGVASWDYDPASGIVDFDQSVAVAMGYGRGGPEPLERVLSRLDPASAARLQQAVDDTCKTGKPLSLEVMMPSQYHPDVPRVVLLSAGAMWQDGKVSRLAGTMQEISWLRRQEQEIANQDRLRQQLLENTSQGIWFLDDQGMTTDLNPAMCRLLGRSREAVVGKSVFEFFVGADLAILHHQLELRKRGHREGYEIGIERPDSTRVECFNNATPLYDAEGRKLGSVGMWTDLTPLKNALAAAEAASLAKSEFLSQVSHELRTPLNAILGFAQLLQTDRQHPLAPAQQLKVQEMLSGASLLLDLINGLLDLGRIESGQFSVTLRTQALEPLLRECLRLVAPVAQTRGITLQLEAGIPSGLAVHADATRLTQVMVNLLGNAIKYNRAAGRVQVRALASRERVKIEVQDTGLGLSEQEQQRLFEPFQRLRAEGSGVEGTGIGLALSRRLAQAMSGDLSVRSAAGEGSTFTVDIARAPDLEPAAVPAAHTAQAPAAADDAEPAGALATPLPATVLYIEDNPVNAMVMEAMVTRIEGLRMLHAEDGLPGLQMAIEHAPQLILTDIQMPEMDGFTLLQHLREQESTRHTPVVAVTADATPASLERGRQAGFSDYLTKPVQMEALHKVLRRLLSTQPPDEGAASRP